MIKSSLLFDDERKTREDGNYSAYNKKFVLKLHDIMQCSTVIF